MEIRKRRLRVTFLYLALLCLLIGGISAYVYNQISREISGSGAGFLDFSVLRGAGDDSIPGVKAAVLYSKQTEEFLAWTARQRIEGGADGDHLSPAKVRENYRGFSDFWISQLEESKITVRLVADEVLTQPKKMGEYNMLILPAVYCLSEEQIDAVKAFLGNRNSVIFTHFSGNRYEDGRDRTWSLLSDIIGAELSHPTVTAGQDIDLIFMGGNPVSADISPGIALPIKTFDGPVSAKIKDLSRTFPVSVWPDSAGFLPMTPTDKASVVYGNYRGGRFVWFGFTAQSVQTGPRNWPHFRKLVDNAFRWAGRQPTVERAAWPGGNRAAATAAVIARDYYYEPSPTEQIFRRNNIPHAVFVGNSGSQVMPGISVADRAQVETGLFSKRPLAGEELTNEITELNQERKTISERWKLDIGGAAVDLTEDRPFQPSEALDFDYIWALDKKVYSPVMVPFGRGTSRPFFSRTPTPLVMIGQSARGFEELPASSRPQQGGRLTEMLLRDLERVRNLGGLYSITFEEESEALLSESTLEPVFQALKGNGIWLASPREIADWWSLYSLIKLQVEQDGGRFTLRVSNEGNQEVEEFRVFIYSAVLPSALEIRAERMRTPIPDYEIDPDLGRIELKIRELESLENRTYYIDY